MGEQAIGGISASRLQQTYTPEAPTPAAVTRGTQAAATSTPPNHGPAMTVDRAPPQPNRHLFSAPRPTASPHAGPDAALAPSGGEHGGWSARVGAHIPGTHEAVRATEDWARLYSEGEARGGLSGRTQQVLAGVAGSLSVLATPEHVVETAVTLGTAALGAGLGRAATALESRAAVLTAQTSQAAAAALDTAASTGAPINLAQTARLAQMANVTRHTAEVAETAEHLVDVAHLAEYQHSVDERVHGERH